MPILMCLAIAGIFYYLLIGSVNDGNKKDKSTENDQIEKEICGKCHKEIDTNWRYCPFCGAIGEEG